MEAIAQQDFVSVENYLAGEFTSEVKHDYIGGVLYAMAGATVDHNLISLNIASAFRNHLRGKPCRAFMADVKIRMNIMGDDVFYYPDVMVGCDPRDTHRLYLCYPKLIVEVSSQSTERLDRREKRWSYQTIETMEEFLLVSQNRLEATLFRRTNSWLPEAFTQPDQIIQLQSIELALGLSAIYEGVKS